MTDSGTRRPRRSSTARAAVASRPPLPPNAGIHSIQLDLETTRDELAHSLDDLFAAFNLRLLVRSRPALFAALAVVGGALTSAAVLARLRGRAGRV